MVSCVDPKPIVGTHSATYRLFGMCVASDFPLPAESAGESPGVPDVRYRRVNRAPPPINWADSAVTEKRCDCAYHRGAVISRLRNDLDGTWIDHASVATFRVSADTRCVDVYVDPERPTDEHLIGLFLAGQMTAHVLHERGFPSLHGSAVVIDGDAVAFLGVKGRGKSTMAACCLRRGAELLTDDILCLDSRPDGTYGLPSLPMMKLWPLSVDGALSIDHELANVHRDFDKKLFVLGEHFPFARRACRLSTIYLLDRYDPVTVGRDDIVSESIDTRHGMAALMDHTLLRSYLSDDDLIRLSPALFRLVTQVSMRTLHFPHGFAYHDRIYKHIVDDIRSIR